MVRWPDAPSRADATGAERARRSGAGQRHGAGVRVQRRGCPPRRAQGLGSSGYRRATRPRAGGRGVRASEKVRVTLRTVGSGAPAAGRAERRRKKKIKKTAVSRRFARGCGRGHGVLFRMFDMVHLFLGTPPETRVPRAMRTPERNTMCENVRNKRAKQRAPCTPTDEWWYMAVGETHLQRNFGPIPASPHVYAPHATN